MLTSFLFLCVLQAGCSKPEELQRVKFSGQTMGTTYHITVVPESEHTFSFNGESLHQDVDTELHFINETMSTYIPDSELMRVNAAPVGEWITVSTPLMEVLTLSNEISKTSDGSFDVTVGPLVNLWGFGPELHMDEVPAPAAITELKARMGYQYLEIGQDNRIRKHSDIHIDLSAIAKGYGVDRIANVIENAGIHRYMVEIGGEIRTKGHNERDVPWVIAIEKPSMLNQEVFTTISLDGAGMATSGDYRNYFEKEGKRYSHTINPVTGYPIEHTLASVTIIAPTAAEADGWATAIMVAGVEKGLEIGEQRKLAVYMIVKEGDGFVERFSEEFLKYRQL